MLNFIHSPIKKRKGLTNKPRPQNKPWKIQIVENITNIILVHKQKKVAIKPYQELKDLKLDLDNKNHGKTIKKVISTIKISSKIYKSITFKEVISDLIYF